jgi:hypothetical protein
MGKKKEPVWPYKKKGDIGIKTIKKEIEAIAEEVKKREAAEKPEPKEPEDVEVADAEGAWAYMLKDMRSVYKSAGGRAKLLKLIKADDKLLMAMVKELMKVEASLMATEMRSKTGMDGGEKPVTFVILKGLYTDAEVKKITDGPIDIDQVTDAINPLSQPKLEYQEEMVRPE